jgi:putative tryptophan/tyrosine transport system substrate-binding protein
MAPPLATQGPTRRAFVALGTGAAACLGQSLPTARAQQAPQVIGFLSSRSREEATRHIAAFQQGLNALGYVEGTNVTIVYRWAEGRYERLGSFAADLATRQVTVIAATGGNVSATAARTATDTVPIVFIAGDDPVKLGLVASLNRPGGNATGMSIFTSELGPKRLNLLHELVPKASTIGLLVNPDYPGSAPEVTAMQTAARTIERSLVVLDAAHEDQIDKAFATFARQQVTALVVSADSLFVSRRDQLVALAARHSIPTIYDLREYAEAGGLISYGTSLTDIYRQVGVYCGRILRGVKPADLPVVQPTRFELVINLATAKTLRLNIPPTLLALADEVIE